MFDLSSAPGSLLSCSIWPDLPLDEDEAEGPTNGKPNKEFGRMLRNWRIAFGTSLGLGGDC